MRISEYEEAWKAVEKLSLSEKHALIKKMQDAGFKIRQKEIKEIVKDKWIFVESNSDSDIVDIDSAIVDWNDAEQLRIEKEQAKSGDTVIDRYFKKYGTLKYQPEKKTHSSMLYFDGKARPGRTWNAELHFFRIGSYGFNRNDYTFNYVKFYADLKVEDSIDAKMKNDEPTIHHCHDWHTNPHKKCVKHYSHDKWLQDIQDAKDKYLKEVSGLIGEYSEFYYSVKTNKFWIPEKHMFWFEEKCDHNGDEISLIRSDIRKTSYKNSDIRGVTRKVPAKFDRMISRGEILEMVANYCEEKIVKYNMRREFKYN